MTIKAWLFKKMLQNRHWFEGKLHKEKADWFQKEPILQFRAQVEAGAERFGKLPKDLGIHPVRIGDLYAEWITVPGADSEKIILYFHGGGYVSGTCFSHRVITSKFVRQAGRKALLFEYRLAPEHPYPAALNDAVAAYAWLLQEGYLPANISFIGDSAGGGLCLATLLKLRDEGYPLPACAAVYSPVTDMTCSGETHQTKLKVCLSPEGMAQGLAHHYAAGENLQHPYISPLFGELNGLPPLWIVAGEDETLCDDAVRFAHKAAAQGTQTALRVGKGLFHCYPAVAPLFKEAQEAMADIVAFIQRQH